MSTWHPRTADVATSFSPAGSSPAGGEPLDVLVIGAGQAGLAMAWHLNRTPSRYLVVDAAPEVGHSWRTRWDSLRLFTPARYDGLPGSPFPTSADVYPGKDQVADYLRMYAETHAFPILTGTPVQRLRPTAEGFEAVTSQGMLRARQVVVATGPFQRPHVPKLASGFDPGLPQIHSGDYRNADRLSGDTILVVGGGNSGLQIAEELRRYRRVVLAVGSQPPVLPQRLLGRDLFWWLTRFGLISQSADSPLGRRVRARGDLIVGDGRRRLRRRGLDIRPRLSGADGWTAQFADGSTAAVDTVIWATGYRCDYSWIDAPVAAADGQPIHHGGRSPVPGLWYLGLPWQRGRGSALLGFVQHDAAHLAAQLADHALR
jgi:putative flavoprotein involved in K+ transport